MLKKSRNIIHVEIKSSKEHLYFGSVSALYKHQTIKELIGIEYQTFRTKNLTTTMLFENDNLIIRKGDLLIIDYIKS